MRKLVLSTWRGYLLAVSAVAAIGFAAIVVGYVAGQLDLADRARDRLAGALADFRSHHKVTRSQATTAYHIVDITRIPLGRAYHIEEVNGRVVFTSIFGQLGTIIDERAVSLPGLIPIGMEALRRDGASKNPAFDPGQIRVTDLLAVETAPTRFDLYAASTDYEDGCIFIQVNKRELVSTPEAVELSDEDWTRVFRTRDCVKLLPDGTIPGGTETGGRMVRFGPDAIAVSVGSLANDRRIDNLDPNSDFGTLVVLPLNGEPPWTFVRGLRNAQGLVMTRSGDIWETEHGPMGGDELNLLVEGRNYGWPFVTYGMEYGGVPTPWPHSPRIASHDGYERPFYAWIPSIGASNLVQPDPGEFPNWEQHLVVSSLRGQSLHIMRIEPERVPVEERLPLPGTRIRDIINLRDGRMLLAADVSGDLIILSNAERSRDDVWQPRQIDLSQLDPRITNAAFRGEAAHRITAEERGANAFAANCRSCHTLFGEANVGPPLGGVIGRQVGGYAQFNYSPALKGRKETWTADRLQRFAQSPQSMFPGTAMAPVNISAGDARDIARYLARQSPATPAAIAPEADGSFSEGDDR